VPYRYRGQHVIVIYSDTIVEIFHKHQRLALHKRSRIPKGYSTIPEHMPPNHQAMSDWNPQRLINWAQNIGENVKLVIENILSRTPHPEQGYKTCLGILSLAKKFGPARLEQACQRARGFDYYSYKGIKNILDKNLENSQLDCFNALPEHHNLRGHHYYQTGA
jgi:transposase